MPEDDSFLLLQAASDDVFVELAGELKHLARTTDGNGMERMDAGIRGVEQQAQLVGEGQDTNPLLRRQVALGPDFLVGEGRSELLRRGQSHSQQLRIELGHGQRSRRQIARPRNADVLGHRARHLEHALNRLQPLLAVGHAELVHQVQAVQRIDAAEQEELGQLGSRDGAVGTVGSGAGGWGLGTRRRKSSFLGLLDAKLPQCRLHQPFRLRLLPRLVRLSLARASG